MATEPKRYAQRGTKVGEKTKLKNLPTALRDEPSYGRSLSFRNDSSLKTSTGGSGGSNLIPRSRVDMASGDRNIGNQKPTAGPKNIVPRGTSQPGPVRPEIPSSARTMKDVQGIDRAKALSGPAESLASKASRVSSLSRAGLGLGAALYSKNAGEGSDFKGNDRPAPYSGLQQTGYNIPKDFGMKNSSEDWEDKKSDTPKAPVVKTTPTKTGASKTGASKTKASKGESQASRDARMAAYEDWEDKKSDTPKAPVVKTTPTKTGASKTGASKTKASKGESQASRDARMAAYEDWVKTNRDPATASYLKTGHMKKGGKVKAKPMKAFAKGGSVRSAASRGDGCATKGHTKGRIY
jgi:hypothetical protein